ncbi:MAG: S41 family peptidase [Clostridia bacterium]|nr:S41 family peptidase [Clostridia bacterium]
MNTVKRNHVLAALVCVLLLCAVYVTASAAYGPMFKRQGEITISREEYDRLKQYEKLDMLLALSEMYYYEDLDTEKMMEQAAYGLVYGIGDVYSTYLSKEDMEAFNEEVEGEFAGIGCQLLADSSDKLITVTRVFKGSPAEKAGVLPGDKIVYVNDVYYTAYEMDAAVDVMRGTPGESVKVTVMRDLETIDFDIVREVVNINYVEYEILEDNIGYVIVFDFMGDAIDGVKEAIEAFKAAGVKAMILDLRGNGGGLLDASAELADLILPEGVVVSTKTKDGREEKFTIDNEYYDVPLVLLVNEYSASASEIVAGAVRDSGEGMIVGTKTFGKGVVQTVIPFPDGSALKITLARYYTPSGECIHEVGIMPHVEVELDEDAVTRYGINNLPHEQDAQLQKAIELIQSGQVK